MKWLSGVVLLLVVGAVVAWWLVTLPKSTVSLPVVAEPKVEEGAAEAQGGEEKPKVEAEVEQVKFAPAVEAVEAKHEGALAGRRPAPQVVAVEVGKEVYGALTELRAVLESQSWDDAARLVTSLDGGSTPGVAPSVGDKDLMTSLAVAVELVLQDYPQVRAAIDEKYAALGKLRVAQATAAGDVPRVELATVQFAGTEAATDAGRWLGDRALAAGFFAKSLSHYERAGGGPADSDFVPRIRLAGAMLGRDLGRAPERAVEFGDVSMSVQAFEALVAEMRQRGAGLSSDSLKSAGPVPKPGWFKAHVRSRLDGAVGDRPADGTGRRMNQLGVPWVDRQIAAAVAGDVMYVANHFQVAAYRLTTGERMWQGEKPPGQMQRAQEWAAVPMRPLIAGDRVFVRLLYSANPVLVCYEKSTGKLLWVGESREREQIVSDPLLIDGQLVALCVAMQPDQQGLLTHCTFDLRTGEIFRQRELVKLKNSWSVRSCCEVTAVENGLVATLGGATIGVDGQGELRWVRSHAMSGEEDARGLLQMFDRPLMDGGRLYVAQPGVRTVDCLSAETGRLIWSVKLTDVVGIVGIAGDVLVVRTEGGIRGLEMRDGESRWRYEVGELFSFQLVDRERLLLACRERVAESSDEWQVGLHWLNPGDGTLTASTPVAGLQDSEPRLGPLVAYGERIFTFVGRGQQDVTREVVELVSK